MIVSKRLEFSFLMIGAFLLLSFYSQAKEKEIKKSVSLKKAYEFNVKAYDFQPPRIIPGMKETSPNGETIQVNSHYVSKKGKPWISSYGEFQYSRYPSEQWEDAILKMKSQGFYGVSTYVFWIHHEEVEGEWNFSGRMNLRYFIELCKKHDMGVFMRIGPWVNGECRNGGHPDWLLKKIGDQKNPLAHHGTGGKLRTTAPEYLKEVDRLYYQLSKQMEGLYWKDGGPIFAIQLDNEYTKAHSGIGGTALIEREKEMALKYGMSAPIFTTTAWNGAEYIQDHTIPVHGSYGAYFWNKAEDYFRTPAYSFSNMRAVDDIDTEVNPMQENEIYDFDEYNNNPYMTCETGIGMNIAYHRRTNLTAADNGAVSLVELGSGCNGMGYYMNIGGSNPVGKKSNFNRSHKLGSIGNPIVSNDFQSAIGEFGQIRESFYEYPVQLNFMADFGEYLAPCRTFIPQDIDEMQGKDLLNSNELQRALRSDGEKAFLFVNNQVKHDTLVQFNDVQFEIELKNESYTIPQKPIDIPIHSYFYWPINLNLSDVSLRYATAQPVLFLEESSTYIFFKNEDIPAEFVFDSENIKTITGEKVTIEDKGDQQYVSIKKPGLNTFIDVALKDNSRVRFIVLSENQAKHAYKHNDKLYVSDAEIVLFNQEKIEVISEQLKNNVWIYPSNPIQAVESTKEGLFEKIEVNFDAIKVDFSYTKTQDGTNIKYQNEKAAKGNNVGVPEDSVFARGTILDLEFPNNISKDLYDFRIYVDYEASALRFYKNDKFLYDNYYNATCWMLSARHLLQDYEPDTKVQLKFLPLQPKDAIFIAGEYWPDTNHKKNLLKINELKPVPVYRKVFKNNEKLSSNY